MTYDPLFLPFFSPVYISLIDLTNTLQSFNYKYIFLMTNMLVIIIGLFVYNYYYFLLYGRFHSSPVEQENLRSKVVLMGNSTKFLKIDFLTSAKNPISTKCCFHLPNHYLLVIEKSISNKWKKSIAKTISFHNIYFIWYRYVNSRFHGNVRNPCYFDIYLINVVSSVLIMKAILILRHSVFYFTFLQHSWHLYFT